MRLTLENRHSVAVTFIRNLLSGKDIFFCDRLVKVAAVETDSTAPTTSLSTWLGQRYN
jgi:hypothetical protein